MYMQTGLFHGTGRAVWRTCQTARLRRFEWLASLVVVVGIASALAILYRGLITGSAMAPTALPPAEARAVQTESYASGYSAGYDEGRRLASTQQKRLARADVDRVVRTHVAGLSRRVAAHGNAWADGYTEGARFGLRQGLIDRFPPASGTARVATQPEYEIISGDIGPLGEATDPKEAKALAAKAKADKQDGGFSEVAPLASDTDGGGVSGGIRRVVSTDGSVTYTNQ